MNAAAFGVGSAARALCREWLDVTLSTGAVDHGAAEAAITALYREIGQPPPRFHWVRSPLAALTTLPPGVPPSSAESVDGLTDWPLPRRFISLATELRLELDTLAHRTRYGLDPLLRQEVRQPLTHSWDSVAGIPLTLASDTPSGRSWYQTLSKAWIAFYDAFQRVGGIILSPEQSRRLALWITVARSCDWWWPRDGVCVVTERPDVRRYEKWDGETVVRLHSPSGPAVRYADGFSVHAWHGTPVPEWVLTDPAVWRIERETNIEVRRCAIERIGWASYVSQAGLRLIATAADPGNPGMELRLYALRKRANVLLATNGSVERDGQRRQYGLTVPAFFDDPVAAAGWTYGLTADQYATLRRRT